MAVMTSQSDSIALDQKSQSLDMAASTSAALTDERNGLEVNGHASPKDSKLDATDNAKEDAPSAKDQLTSNESNKDAFASNQSISAMTPPAADSAGAAEAPKNGDDAGASEAQDTKDTEMVDAPTESAQAPSPPAEPVSNPSPKPDLSPEAAAEKPVEAETPAAPAESAESTDAAKPSSPTARSPVPAEPKENTVKAESSPEADKEKPSAPADEPQAGTEKVEEKEATVAATTQAPASGSVSPLSKPATDVSPKTSSAPVTVDTSMTDAGSQASAKMARGRDEDVDEEPAAKRVRTSGEDGAKAEAAQPRPDTSAAPDVMDIDKPAAPPAPAPVSRSAPTSTSPVPLTVNGQSRKLNDPALANNTITSYQNREIKKVLGLVKKTKHGQLFRASVRNLWPGIWESYRSTINRPVDISFMEQNLRENKYKTMADFRADVDLLHENSGRFNGVDHDVTRAAKSTAHQIYARLAEVPAQEPSRSNTKEVKQMPSRHAEHRSNPPPPKSKPRPVASLPAEKVSDSPVFAIPPSGVPTIRRDSTKNNSDRPKRPIHPPKNKDLGFQPKNPKNKRKPEMKFCEEVLRELKHGKHYLFNQWFLEPVDPVALNIPTYHSIIKQPMDLGTMSEKLDNGEYESANAFKADFNLLVKNCFKFNPEGTVAHMAGKDLEKVFEKKWSEKGAWMSKHTQASAHAASATSPRGATRDDDDDDDGESEPEKENASADVQKAEQALTTIQERLKKEQDNLDKQLYSSEPDAMAIEISRGIIKHLQDEMVKKRAELNTLREKKPMQAKPAKKKASGGAASAPKKSSGNAGGPPKKPTAPAKKPTKKRLSDEEKEIVSDAISRLEGQSLTRAIEIIKRDTNLTEGDDDELELDMEMLSEDALLKLFDLVLKAFPHYRDQLKKHEPAPAPAPAAPAGSASAAKAAKKKNKPMGKAEQERKLEQLKALKNSYKRPGSGSQEPVPSIEPNDGGLFGNHHDDSDDASSSEEE